MYLNTEYWVPVLRTRDWKQSSEAGLVLTALKIEHEVERVEGRWVVTVPADSAARAHAELSEYAEESRRPPVGILPIPELGTGWRGVVAYVGALLAVALFARQGAWGYDWLGLGRIDSVRILAGEWWRNVTALTLHVEFSHLAGNIVFGAFFGLYVGRYLGSGIGWAAILGAGALGNALNVLIQPGRHLAIGASTSVFAALGLLAAYTWRRGFLRKYALANANRPHRRRDRLAGLYRHRFRRGGRQRRHPRAPHGLHCRVRRRRGTGGGGDTPRAGRATNLGRDRGRSTGARVDHGTRHGVTGRLGEQRLAVGVLGKTSTSAVA